MLNNSLDDQIQKHETKIGELEIQMNSLDSSVAELLEALNITPEQLTAFLTKQEHFTEENWKEISKQQLQLDEKLKCDLNNIRNPIQAKKARSSLHVERHWLYVR